MKAYLAVSGILFALFGVWHFVLAFGEARAGGTAWLGPAAVGVVSLALAFWALRLGRRA